MLFFWLLVIWNYLILYRFGDTATPICFLNSLPNKLADFLVFSLGLFAFLAVFDLLKIEYLGLDLMMCFVFVYVVHYYYNHFKIRTCKSWFNVNFLRKLANSFFIKLLDVERIVFFINISFYFGYSIIDSFGF